MTAQNLAGENALHAAAETKSIAVATWLVNEAAVQGNTRHTGRLDIAFRSDPRVEPAIHALIQHLPTVAVIAIDSTEHTAGCWDGSTHYQYHFAELDSSKPLWSMVKFGAKSLLASRVVGCLLNTKWNMFAKGLLTRLGLELGLGLGLGWNMFAEGLLTR